MARTCTATINLSAIKHNYQYAKSLAPNSKAIAIIKANAYGHGAVEVAEYLEDCADAFGVACTEEAIEIRKAGIEKRPILLLEGVYLVEPVADLIPRTLPWKWPNDIFCSKKSTKSRS